MINLIGILNRLLMYEKYVNDTIIVTVIISITIKYIKERILNFRCGLSFIL